MKIENEIIARTNEAEDFKLRWWSDFLFNVSKNVRLEQQIMDKMQNELRNYEHQTIDRYIML